MKPLSLWSFGLGGIAVLLSSLPACGGAAAPRAPAGSAERATPSARAGAPTGEGTEQPKAPTPIACMPPPLQTEDGAALLSAATAYAEGRVDEAILTLERLVRTRPADLTGQLLLEAALERRAALSVLAGVRTDALSAVTLATPAAEAALHQPAPGAGPAPPTTLKIGSDKKNLITDEAAWRAEHQLEVPLLPLRFDTAVPSHVPLFLGGAKLEGILRRGSYDVGLYAERFGVFAPGRQPRVFDARGARSAGPSFEVSDAALSGDVLVVQYSQRGSARRLGGLNGHLAAYDASSGALLWQTGPLVGNANNFVLSSDRVITSYGAGGEAKHVSVIELATGKLLAKAAIPATPETLVWKGDALYLRSYDHDLILQVTPPLTAPTPPRLAEGPASSDALRGDQPCWLAAALHAAATRDAKGLERAREQLGQGGANAVVIMSALERIQAFLARAGSATAPVDLWSRPVTVPEAPPWEAKLGAGEALSPVKLVQVSQRPLDPGRARDAIVPGQPVLLAPVKRGVLPPGVYPDVPSTFGGESLHAVIPDGQRRVLIYGGRYVFVVEGSQVAAALDVEAYRHPPKANPQWAEFATQDATFARERDGVVYVCNGGGSYAKEVYGKKGYLSAIDGPSGRLLWRSAALTCNSTIEILDDLIVTGYGFTSEAHRLTVLSRRTGRPVGGVQIQSSPERLRLDGATLHVDAYRHRYEFTLQR